RRVRPVAAVLAGVVRRPRRQAAGRGLPLQARNVLSVRAAGRSASRQRPGTAGARRARRRAAAGGGPRALVPGLGRSRPLTAFPDLVALGDVIVTWSEGCACWRRPRSSGPR